MKALFTFLAIAALSATASAEVITTERAISVSDMLVSSPIPANSDAKVVVSGMFPNTCYNWSRSEVTHPETFRHELRAYALVSQTTCLMVLVPYTKEIYIGRLPAGEHTLRFINGDETWFEKKLIVQ